MSEVVKVQRCIQPPNGPGLIYDRKRRHEVMEPLADTIIARMGDDVKLFFFAEWTGKTWAIGEKAPWQTW